jgi:hypothetical protein
MDKGSSAPQSRETQALRSHDGDANLVFFFFLFFLFRFFLLVLYAGHREPLTAAVSVQSTQEPIVVNPEAQQGSCVPGGTTVMGGRRYDGTSAKVVPGGTSHRPRTGRYKARTIHAFTTPTTMLHRVAVLTDSHCALKYAFVLV